MTGVSLPGCDVAGQPIDAGDRARCFAEYMRIHALEASGGYTYSQMGQYEAKKGVAEQMGLFGIALVLAGLGFAVLVLTGAVRDPETTLSFLRSPKRAEAT